MFWAIFLSPIAAILAGAAIMDWRARRAGPRLDVDVREMAEYRRRIERGASLANLR